MELLAIILLLVLVMGVLLDGLISRSFLTSVSLVNTSWVGVLVLASTLFLLDVKTIWAVFLGLLGFNLARVSMVHLRIFKNEFPEDRANTVEKVVFVLLVLQVLFQVSLIPRMLAISLYYADNPSLARLASFGLSEDGLNLIVNPYLNLYQFYVGYFLQWFGFLFGMLLFLRKAKLRLLVLGMSSMVLDAVVMLGRFQVVWMIAFILIMLLIIRENAQHREKYKLFLRWGKRISVISLVVAGILIIGMTQLRTQKEASTSSHLLYYPSIGLAIFNAEMQNPLSRTNMEDTYGRCFFGGLDKPFSLVYHVFCKECEAPATENARYFSNPFMLTQQDGQKMYANAFNTCLSSFYMDAGWFGVFLFPFIVGFFIRSGLRQFRAEGNELALVFSAVLLHGMVFSLAQSWFEFHVFWFSIVALILIDRVPRLRK